MENDLTISEMKQMQFQLYEKTKKNGLKWANAFLSLRKKALTKS